jgi:hypothetical protein
MTADALGALMRAADDEGIAFISDEIYHGLDYAFAAQTALAISNDAVVINSFSKYFCMTGWRVGWMVVPNMLVRPIERLQQNLAISVPTLSQIAAEAAFEGSAEMEAVKRGYEASRRLLIERLPRAGLATFPPMDGAFLSLCRRLRLLRGQLRLRLPHFAGDGRCRDARRRLRPRQWPPLHPALLCGRGGRRRRGRGADWRLAQAGISGLAPRSPDQRRILSRPFPARGLRR